jgi:methylated-DNA-protein-cysteine methyltransferase related protein
MFEKLKRTMARVPYGKVATYGQIAQLAGFPGAARQVAWALHNSTGLPWHRIVGAGGKISLSGEAGFEQRMRLQGEGVEFRGLRVDMKSCGWVPSKRVKSSGTKAKRGSAKHGS